MLSSCLKCWKIYKVKKTKKNNNKKSKTKNRKIMLSADCEVCCSKTLRFIKGQEARGLLLGPN